MAVVYHTMKATRYSRHRPLLSETAWKRMMDTPVVLAGIGGLGTHVAMSLSRLAPLMIELWDPAVVDEPDLNRQIFYVESSVGRTKTDTAVAALSSVNAALTVFAHQLPISAAAFHERTRIDIGRAGNPPFILFDCLDSFAARAELEQIRLDTGCTVIHGGVTGWYGQATTFPGEGPGYSDAFGPDYATMPAAAKPILPATVAFIAALQVNEYLHVCGAGLVPEDRQAPEGRPASGQGVGGARSTRDAASTGDTEGAGGARSAAGANTPIYGDAGSGTVSTSATSNRSAQTFMRTPLTGVIAVYDGRTATVDHLPYR